MRGIPHDWFEGYLHNRTQFFEIGYSQSNAETITFGIPQGSTLGPLLILLYINDLPYFSKKLSFRIYPFVYLLMIQICFLQVITCSILSPFQYRPKANNNYGTSDFAFALSQLWETIPTNIKRLLYTSFCNGYKLYHLNTQPSEQPSTIYYKFLL